MQKSTVVTPVIVYNLAWLPLLWSQLNHTEVAVISHIMPTPSQFSCYMQLCLFCRLIIGNSLKLTPYLYQDYWHACMASMRWAIKFTWDEKISHTCRNRYTRSLCTSNGLPQPNPRSFRIHRHQCIHSYFWLLRQ